MFFHSSTIYIGLIDLLIYFTLNLQVESLYDDVLVVYMALPRTMNRSNHLEPINPPVLLAV